MVEIEFSVMQGAEGDVDSLLPLLEEFEKRHYIHVNLSGITWAQGWAEVAKFGIYGHGPDVSSIGTTWIGSMAAMQALRPFSPQEIRAVGGAQAFFESNWRAGFLPNDPTPWAIPWVGDAMVIYYWKDAIQKAGIQDAKAAFASDAALRETLDILQKSGYAYPLAITTARDPVILHEMSHWLWSAGGDYLSPDCTSVTFNEPAALKGLYNYFSLLPFISPESLTSAYGVDLFIAGKAAVHVAGPWLGMIGRYQHPEWGDRLGIAQAPGSAFVGGSSFVIWKYSKHSQEAFELVRFLACQPARFPVGDNHHLELPIRREAVNLPSVKCDIFQSTYLNALQNGRGFPTTRLWGLVEDKLIVEINKIWSELFVNPGQDLDACLYRHFDLLAERLSIVLGD